MFRTEWKFWWKYHLHNRDCLRINHPKEHTLEIYHILSEFPVFLGPWWIKHSKRNVANASDIYKGIEILSFWGMPGGSTELNRGSDLKGCFFSHPKTTILNLRIRRALMKRGHWSGRTEKNRSRQASNKKSKNIRKIWIIALFIFRSPSIWIVVYFAAPS